MELDSFVNKFVGSDCILRLLQLEGYCFFLGHVKVDSADPNLTGGPLYLIVTIHQDLPVCKSTVTSLHTLKQTKKE